MFPLIFEQVSLGLNSQPKLLLDSINVRIEKAGTLLILGPNGAGKSLFLRLAHQLIKPTQGQISWAIPSKLARQQQAMVFQHPILLNRSAYANLEFALKLKNEHTKIEQQHLIEAMLEQMNLQEHAKTSANVLSFGEQQKLALARAMIIKPKVLFLDEPTASLDPSASYQIEQFLSEVATTSTKIIMASHDLNQAKRLADQVLFLHQGKILEHTEAALFFKKPQSKLGKLFLAGELLWKDNRSLL